MWFLAKVTTDSNYSGNLDHDYVILRAANFEGAMSQLVEDYGKEITSVKLTCVNYEDDYSFSLNKEIANTLCQRWTGGTLD